MSATSALYLKDVGQKIGLENWEFDANGRALAILDGGLQLSVRAEPDTDVVELSTQLSAAPGSLPKQTLRELLEANFLGQGTGSATLGIRAGTLLLLERLDLASVSSEAFQQTVERFLNLAENWKEFCRLAGKGLPPAAESAAETSAPLIRG